MRDTTRLAALRRRVRAAMEQPPVRWECPARIAECYMAEPLAVRKARAIALKLAAMPTELWRGQLFAGSMTLEEPRVHAEWGFPDYATDAERDAAAAKGLSIRSVFGHVVPDYPTLLAKGLRGIRADAEAQRPLAATPQETAFLDSVAIALDAVMDFAARLATRCEAEAGAESDAARAAELRQMAANLRQAPAGPSLTFWQALQSVWLLHMIFHSTMNGNALGRLDQYAWPLLEADLAAGRLTLDGAAELVGCFCLKFNERAKTTDEQRPEAREPEPLDPARRTRHYTSSQIGTRRDGLDATNHWLQNIVVGGLTPEGADGTNPLSFLLLDAYARNEMTNPLLTVRLHRGTPEALLRRACEVLKAGGGMPALFNDEALVPALERLGIPTPDARDYTNDGCWEVILPGRTNFVFQRLSLMLCLLWALGRDRSEAAPDTGDPRAFASFDDVWRAFLTQMDSMVGRVVRRVADTVNDRSTIAPVPLLSALMDGAIAARRDMTAGGSKYRTFGMLAESAAHAIDSLVAIKTVLFEQRAATMAELCDALAANFEGHEALRRRLLCAPKYGNDDGRADAVGRDVIAAFTEAVARHAEAHRATVLFPAGVGTFSWYIGIGEGLGASPDGRLAGEPVSSNFSPALGRDLDGLPSAILSYAKMHPERLPAGGPLDLRLARRLVEGDAGTARMAGLVRGFVESGGAMMTLTVADTEELRAAQREPDRYQSLRVRMGGWCAYFTMLSREQQDHHIRRQEARS
ncbi:MAG TPA: pyruvate formate lyase family protein [Planctomycetota bacterium]|nr:pyruvate formate lyase family protein [Planctomycetota bacterium]HRR81167.1 pyruvate formate lyase family protein [Planctomycetota bacterium]HRT95565.1 pyruvate formate lyase family protein [Planctomycetota bacterium]